MPVICSAASTIADAIAPCATTTPCSSGGGVASLIIVLQVLAEAALLLHAADQALVERGGDIHTGVAEQVHHRDHFGDDGDVLAGIEGHDHARELHAENVGFLLGQAAAVGVLRGLPVLELHHHLDALLLAHRAH